MLRRGRSQWPCIRRMLRVPPTKSAIQVTLQSPMLRYIIALCLALLVSAGTTYSNPSPSPQAPISGQPSASAEQLTSMTQTLLGYAASDFRAHSTAVAQVRKVRVGHLLNARGHKQYLVCGEFLPAGSETKGGWTTFATIKTDPYEQWLGGQADSWCHNPKVKWEKSGGDLSAALRSKLAPLK